MRIAFTSCFSAQLFKQQLVWDEIAAAQPDVLVLLGDSMYLDVGGPYGSLGVQQLSENDFAEHAHSRYAATLAQKQFKALVQSPGLVTYAIWDDHDFLWDNACGADLMKNPALRPLVYPSRALFAAYRQALASRLAPGSFPSAPPYWDTKTPAPGYTCVLLDATLFLHLTDGRSFRKARGNRALLGADQLNALQAAMALAPAGATHLVASASVFDARHGDSWLTCPTEYSRLQTLAQQYNILILSGDIHDNNLASYTLQAGRRLFEATASGAAVRTGVVVGALQRNYGLLDIDGAHVDISLFKSGARQYGGSIHRLTWQ
ncbi:MAG: hypothetical protein V4627_13415 [Pseudomonadota bacterium]